MPLELRHEAWRRAEEDLQAARLLLGHSPRASLSRAYYAMHWALVAYYLEAGRSFPHRKALLRTFSEEAEGTDLAAWARRVRQAERLRERADYDLSRTTSRKTAREVVVWAQELIRALRSRQASRVPNPGGRKSG